MTFHLSFSSILLFLPFSILSFMGILAFFHVTQVSWTRSTFSVSAFSFSIILVQFFIFVVYLTRQTRVKKKKKTFKPSVLLLRIICRHRLLYLTLLGIFRLSSSQKVKSNPLQCYLFILRRNTLVILDCMKKEMKCSMVNFQGKNLLC